MSDEQANETTSAEKPQLDLLPRPPFQLRSLPINFRWEVTRRHPYYQGWWKAAHSHHRQEARKHPAESLLRQAGVVILAAIGVSGEPPDPATSFSDLEEADLKPAWLSGAVHPITFRGMAAILLSALPKDTLGKLGMLFLEAACDDPEDRTSRVISSLCKLQTSDKAGLNDYADEPLVSINPATSARQATEAVGALLKEWKEQRDLAEQRDRSDKYSKYLEVWDRREGWANGCYDCTRERKFLEIAQEVKESPSTISNQYRRAFELIIGHPYAPSLWWRTMGVHKITEFGATSIFDGRRPTRSPIRRPVPEAVVDVSSDEVRHVTREESTYTELLTDIRLLLDEGNTNAEIIEKLQLPADNPKCAELIDYIRSRDEDD